MTINKESKQIVGYMLTKSLLGIYPSESTFMELWCKGEIQICSPIFSKPDAKITDLDKIFKTGYTHMAIICADAASAKK